MATAYEAIVRLRPVNAGAERETSLADLIAGGLPADARITTERDDEDQLVLSVRLILVAADASEVQLQAKDIVAKAVDRAGLTEQAALLEDIAVRASS